MTRTDSAQDEFLQLICADPDLLRAEFDAIVTAGWPSDPPPVRRRRPAGGPPSRPPGRSVRARHSGDPAAGDGPRPAIEDRARQRSPPARCDRPGDQERDQKGPTQERR